MTGAGSQTLSERDLRELVAYADGVLAPGRRAALQPRIEAEPSLAAGLEHQRLALDAIRGAGPKAPPRLHARIQAQRAPRWTTVRSWPRLAIASTAAGVAAVALVLAIGLGGGPTVSEAAAQALAPPTERAPRPAAAAQLDRRIEGIDFPDWAREFGWRAVGARTGKVDGRRTETVFYEHAGHRIGYTIVAGEALPNPKGDTRDVQGTSIVTFRRGAATVVTWRRAEHTCILAADGVQAATLRKLAAATGAGGAGGYY